MSLQSDLQARLSQMLSEHDERINAALVLRGRMLELEHVLQLLAGLKENDRRGVAEENAPQMEKI